MVGSKRNIPLLFSVFLIFFGDGNSDTRCIRRERDALLSFKNKLVDPSNRLSSWVHRVDCCEWDGILCSNSTGHVKEIHLANTQYVDGETQTERDAFENSKLKGQISDVLLNLKYLSHLDLSYNDFLGVQIPSFFGSLVSLNYLNLTHTGFKGLIPHQLGNLSNLQSLGLRGDFFSATLFADNLQWLQRLHSLQHLDLSYVNLSKTSNWLEVMNTLPSLLELRLSDCQLDHMPSLHTANFTSLSLLDLSSNAFNTLIPKWIFNLGNLIVLDLSSSNFEGPIPTGFSNLTSLKSINVARMYLNSTLPEWLLNMKNLVSVDLHDNGFEGPIPCGFQNLTLLQNLDLSECDFNSTIPSCFYTFRTLKSLDLHSLNIRGEISGAIENLTDLVSLDLSNNELDGKIPSSMKNLCNLRSLSLSGNKIGGTVSQVIESLSGCVRSSLAGLDLGGNYISGQITDEITTLRNLSYLNLRGNFISGPLPSSLGNMQSLRVLDLARNKLNGSLPESLGSLFNLERIDISYNQLEGDVTEAHFMNLTNLHELVGSKNQLTFRTSPKWIPPFHLSRIELRSLTLGPKFPIWLKSQTNFWDLDLSNTGISDTIPYWFWNLSTSFLYLNLSHNHISGEIPDFVLNGQFSMIYLGSNGFHGQLPRISANVTELDLSNNLFSGDMSFFFCDPISPQNRLNILHFGENLLSGQIPDCWTNWPSLEVVKLGNNNLTGNIPDSMGSLTRLVSLHLRNNSLSGELPLSLRNCSGLKTLDLGVNDFTGMIPRWIATSLSNLMVLGLRSNKLRGRVPSEICHLNSLQIVDVAGNNLTGTIPSCINNLKAMVTKDDTSNTQITYSFYYGEFLENAYVVTKGRENQYNTILTLVTSIDLSDNNLSGEIPQEITDLAGLLSLNLSGNHLSGTIPENVGNMVYMESLDLSRNQLFGQIPPTISKMTLLNNLNLSFNNLSGVIPKSTQLQSLDPSSFIGNDLCGDPLPKSCTAGGTSRSNGNVGDGEVDHHEDDEDEYFYLSMVVGFVASLLGFSFPLMVSKTWRHTYFSLSDSLRNIVIDSFRRFGI